jgi:DnaA family protein
MTVNVVVDESLPMGSKQLTLGVKLDAEQKLENFSFEGAPALNSSISHLLNNDNAESLYVFGGAGVGKSHVLQACVLKAHEMGQEAIFLSCDELLQVPFENASECLVGLSHFQLLCVDDIDLLINNASWAQAWFHLYNELTETGHRVIFSASSNPRGIDCALEDLRSRLQLANVFQLNELDESASGALLQIKAQQRGLQLTDEHLSYILSRSPRGFKHLLHVLDLLDSASWHEKRRITIPFIKQVLQW